MNKFLALAKAQRREEEDKEGGFCFSNTGQIRVAVICDYLEEEWHSMDLCAQMLLEQLQAEHRDNIQAEQICPVFKKRLKKLPWLNKKRSLYNADRLLNRFWDYPQHLSQQVADFDLFHVCDHTYAQLVHVLPPERTGVFCHDIDAFRSLVEPEQEPRPAWYKAMSQRTLSGLQKAAVVFYSTAEVRRQIEHYGLVERARLVHAPYGISPEFSVLPLQTNSVDRQILDRIGEAPFILHVGSCIPRKRIDVLLEVFAALRQHSNLQLVKVSGDWTASQQEQIDRLDLSHAIIHLHGLERTTIAALYRRASVVLLTSEAEGFGLPVIEALACGAIVVASDIPVLREVGGPSVVYCPVAEVSTWVKTVKPLLTNPAIAPQPSLRLAQAQKYSWSTHAQTIAQTYLAISRQAEIRTL